MFDSSQTICTCTSPESLVATYALAVSIVALGVTIWGQFVQRKHMRLSVRPVASVPLADFENLIAVSLANKGLGPLEITAYWITDKEGKKHSDLMSIMPRLPGGMTWTNYSGDAKGAFIEPGKKLELIRLESDDPDTRIFSEARKAVRNALKNLTIHVEYRDLYKRTMPPKSRELNWFGRHDGDVKTFVDGLEPRT